MKKTLAALLAAAWLLAAPAYAAPEIIDEIATNEKIVALTIEDIGDAAQFEQLLALLREQDAKATFFIPARLAATLPLKKAAGLGHEIGNHSLSHPFWGEAGPPEIAKDLTAAAETLETAVGKPPATVRPPYNWYGDNFLQAVAGLDRPAVVVRGKDAGDWLVDSPAALLDLMLQSVKAGDILNFNMRSKTAAAALPLVAGELKRAGYKVVTVAELIARKIPPKTLPPAGFCAVIERAPAASARVALTFDDGGTPGQTGRILDILRQTGTRATFFLVGKWAVDNPGLVRRMLADGHEIANHTYSHPCLTWLSEEEMRGEILAAQRVLAGIGGAQPRLLRPPYGAYDRTVVALAGELGLRAVVLWDVDTRDWTGAAAGTIYDRVTAGVAPGSIVLFHLQGPNTPDALSEIIPALKAGGYRLTTVSELLDE